jgi:hypothetical protein
LRSQSLTLVTADPAQGFYWPYLILLCQISGRTGPLPLTVEEPANWRLQHSLWDSSASAAPAGEYRPHFSIDENADEIMDATWSRAIVARPS